MALNPFKYVFELFKSKANRPTALRTAQIATDWAKEVKQTSFFSARVASADLLQYLRNQVTEVLEGRATKNQMVDIAQDFLKTGGKKMLAKAGFLPAKDVMRIDGAGPITEASSAALLKLIIAQNVKMAHETAHYQRWQKNAKMFPYAKWHIGGSKEHREEHLARNGRIYPSDHPIWTQSPPGGEFNCKCWSEPLMEDEADGRIEPKSGKFEPSSLGFDPSKKFNKPKMKQGYSAGIIEKIKGFF
jgi:hypothetical protein